MKSRSTLPFFAAFCFSALPLVAADLAEGPGKVLIERECGSCHDAGHVAGKRTRDEWIDTVSKMMERGASLNDKEFDIVIDYLAKNYGKPESKIGVAAPAKK